MQIRTRILGSAALALAATLIAALLLSIGATRSIAADAEQEKAQATMRAIAGLLTLSQEYALRLEPRAAQQWQQEHARLTLRLSDRVQSGESSPARQALQRSAAELPALFERLAELGRQTGSDFAARRKELLIDQLLTHTQDLADTAYRWSREAAAAEQSARQRLRVGGALALLLLLAATLAQPIVVWRRVLRPLAVLERAAVTIERGDFSARCGSAARDELGDLSRRFDAMTETLSQRSRDLQASNESLDREVAKRRRSEQRLRAIADNLPVLIAYIDRDHTYRFVNSTYLEWFDVPIADIEGRRVAEVVDAATYTARRPYLERALAGERVEFEQLTQLPSGPRHVHGVYIPHRENGVVAGLYAMVSDVTAIKETQAQLMQLASFDALTGLPNRYQFNQRLGEAMASARRTQAPMGLLFLDIDRFKSINDKLGHAAGDAVLKEFAFRLRDAVRTTDVIARLGGDEFVIVLAELRSPPEAEQVARKIVAAVRADFSIDGRTLQVTTSIGVALFEGDATSASELMAQADAALYETKRAGRDSYRMHARLAA